MATHEIDLDADEYFNLLKDTNSFKINLEHERYKPGDTVIFYSLSNQFGRLRSGNKIARRIKSIAPIYSASRKVKSIRIYLSI